MDREHRKRKGLTRNREESRWTGKDADHHGRVGRVRTRIAGHKFRQQPPPDAPVRHTSLPRMVASVCRPIHSQRTTGPRSPVRTGVAPEVSSSAIAGRRSHGCRSAVVVDNHDFKSNLELREDGAHAVEKQGADFRLTQRGVTSAAFPGKRPSRARLAKGTDDSFKRTAGMINSR